MAAMIKGQKTFVETSVNSFHTPWGPEHFVFGGSPSYTEIKIKIRGKSENLHVKFRLLHVIGPVIIMSIMSRL